MHSIAKKMIERGHEVTVITSNTKQLKSAELKKEEYIDGVKVKRVRIYQILPYHYLFFAPGIIPAILKEKVDIVHIFSYLPTFITNVAPIISKIKGIPIVMTPIFHPRRQSSIYIGFLPKKLGCFYDNTIGPGILKLADHVTGLTESEVKFYRAKGIRHVSVVPEGISVENNIYVSKDYQREFKEKIGIKDEKVILSVGRIVKYKGLDLLVRAFAKMQIEVPHSKLIIIGEDWGYRKEVEKIANEFGCSEDVIFVGEVRYKELCCAYEIADVVVHPSLFETFCRIALEAWSHKKPIIVFDEVGEPVTPSTGIIVKYKDENGLAEAMVKLLTDKDFARNLGENGYKLVHKRFVWDKIADQFEDIYEHCK